MLISFLFAFVFRLVDQKNISLKHAYMGGVGMLVLQWIYGQDWIHSVLVSSVVYCQLSSFGFSKSRGKAWYTDSTHPFYTFLLSLVYLTWAHWYQLQANPERKFNFTTTQMWLTIKLTTLSTQLYDSKCGGKSLKFPSLLEYTGYLYCFTNMLAGPSFSYQVYLDGVKASWLATHKKQQFDGCLYSVFLFLQGLVCLYLHRQLSPLFTTTGLLELSYRYSDRSVASFGAIAMYYIMYAAQHRLLFYFGWKWFEGACVMAGFGYNPADASWTLASNSDIYSFELGICTMKRVRYWNTSTQQWLQQCIYMKAGRSLLVVYSINALWHGLDAGYYLFAVVLGVCSVVERFLGSKSIPIPLSPLEDGSQTPVSVSRRAVDGVVWLVCWALTFLGITYAQVFFYVLTWSNCKMVWEQTLATTPHCVWLTMCGVLLLAWLLPLKKKKLSGKTA